MFEFRRLQVALILLSRVLCVGNLAPQDLLCHPDPQAGKRTKSMQRCESKIQRAPKSLVWRKLFYHVLWWLLYFRLSRPGWIIYAGILVNEPCPFQQPSRGWARVMPEARTSIRPPRRATWVPWGTSCPRAWRPRILWAAASELSWKLRSISTPSINLVCFG